MTTFVDISSAGIETITVAQPYLGDVVISIGGLELQLSIEQAEAVCDGIRKLLDAEAKEATS